MTDTDQLLRIGEAARELQVSVETLRRWESQGKISGVRSLGNQRRFTRAEVERVQAEASAA